MTAPAVGDDILAAHINLFLQRPMCRLVQQSAQSLPDATATALTFGASSEEFDYTPAPFHDTSTNNTRITPTVAGWYTFRGMLVMAGMNTPVTRSLSFRKNGTTFIAPGMRDAGFASITNSAMPIAALIQCNGTTDYVELIASQDSNGAVNTNASGQLSSVFECVFERYA